MVVGRWVETQSTVSNSKVGGWLAVVVVLQVMMVETGAASGGVSEACFASCNRIQRLWPLSLTGKRSRRCHSRPTLAGGLGAAEDSSRGASLGSRRWEGESCAATQGAHSAYVHIPFCNQRCYYCDFPISIIGKGYESLAVQSKVDGYIDALVKEIAYGGEGGMHVAQGGRHGPLDTVYIGGGTPSLLTCTQMERVLEALRDRFGIQQGAEVTVEMDPGTFDKERAEGFRNLGVNRASMGVQTFDANLLKSLGRAHTVQDVHSSYACLQEAGFQDISLDLMCGLPGQTMHLLQQSLDEAVRLSPSHLSVYDLIVEDSTAFGRWYGPTGFGPSSVASGKGLPDEDLAADMYRCVDRTLTDAGYEHYEISNFAKKGGGAREGAQRSRHNSVYWLHTPFLAFGMGATFYVSKKRLRRPRTLREYLEWVDSDGPSASLVDDTDEDEGEESVQAQVAEAFMVGMRMSDGVCLSPLIQEFGHEAVGLALQALEKHIEGGLVQVEGQGPDKRVSLTVPEGFLLSNAVLVSLFELV